MLFYAIGDKFMQTCLVLDTNIHLVSQHVTTLRGKLVVHQMWKCESNFNSSTSIVYTSKLKFVGLDCTSPSRKSVPIDSSALNNKSNNLNQSSIQSSNISVHRPSFSQLLPDARSSFHLSGSKFQVNPFFGRALVGNLHSGRCRLRTCIVQCSFLLPGTVAAWSELFNIREFGRYQDTTILALPWPWKVGIICINCICFSCTGNSDHHS